MNITNITKKRSKTVLYVTILCTPMYTALTYIIKQKGTLFMTSKELTKLAVAALEDRKAEDVTVIDISEISPIADYFIIANGTNQNQLQAMRDAADEALYKAGVKVQQIEGNQSSTWILMDYGDIIIHIFSKEDRLFYDLERTWRDGKVVDVKEL